MKHLKKLSILALLLIAAVQGAWADGTLQVTEIKASDISAWSGDNTTLSAADLPGFKAVTLDEAKAWADAPASGMAVLFYDFKESGEVKYVVFQNGAYVQSNEQTISRASVYTDLGFTPTFYTSGASSDASNTVDVTPVTGTTNQWTLTMPAGNVELQVEYEPEFAATFKALTANTIGTAATVKLDNVAIDTLTAEKNTLNGIYPGQTVTLTAQQGYKFRKVEAKEGSAKVEITIGDVTLDITGCTTWEDIVNQNSDKLDVDYDGDVYRKDTDGNLMHGSGSWVNKSRTYNANDGYYWFTGEI